MSEKYLGEKFDIHGGGMDLKFPHHECEIAQSVAHNGCDSVHYWMHNNMITINGQKMGKSLGNFITLDEFFNGTHPALTQPYSPMTIRFFILQAQYRSTVDFSNDALQASEKALDRMLEGWRRMADLKPAETSSVKDDVEALWAKCYEALDDDLNTPIVIAHLFEAVSIVNKVRDGHATATQDDIDSLRSLFDTFLFDILGMKPDAADVNDDKALEPYRGAVDLLLKVRSEWIDTGLIRKPELMNAIWKYMPEYAAAYNAQEQAGLHDALAILLQTLGADSEPQGLPEYMISLSPDAGTDFTGFWK